MKSLKKNGLLLFVIFILSALMAPTNLVAQDKKVGFGLQATPALTWMKPNDKETAKNGSKIGFSYGLMFDFRFGENYSLSTGLNMISSSAKLDYLDPDTSGVIFTYGSGTGKKTDTLNEFTATYRVNYIEIPINLILKTNEIGYITYFGQFGLASQIKTKARVDASVNDIDDEDVTEEIKVLNLGLSIGAGFEYSLGGNTKVIVALVYNNGFSDILKNEEEEVTAQSFGLKLGIMF